MAQPIVKYTLNKRGQVPEWIDRSDSSFAGEHAITGNKTGIICGIEFIISLMKIRKGRFLLIINSIN